MANSSDTQQTNWSFPAQNNQSESMWNNTDDVLDSFVYLNSTTNSSDLYYEDYFPLPRFTGLTMAKIIIVAVTFVLSAVGNITFLITSYRLRRGRRSRPLQSLLVHLAIADLIVTFVTMPSLGIWFYTVAWLAGNGMCKLIKSIQVLGLYLSTYITVAISIDRCISVVNPMCRNTAQRRRNMVAVCWILSVLFSIPQAVIFHVQSPVPDFQQCVTFGFYTAKWQEQLYNGLVLVVMYPIPLVVILVCCIITFTSLKREGQNKGTFRTRNPTRERLLLKARNNTLRTTAGIVLSFILCWTPYFVTMVWILFFNWQMVSPVVFDILFLFGIFNSCVNPVVYGISMFKKTTLRPNLSMIEFSSPFLSSRRSASMNSKVSRASSHVSLSTRKSWQPSTESSRSPVPSLHPLNRRHYSSAYSLATTSGRQVRYRQTFLQSDRPTSPAHLAVHGMKTDHRGSSTMSPKTPKWLKRSPHMDRKPLTRAQSSPSVLPSPQKRGGSVRRRPTAVSLTAPTLPIICLTPPADKKNTEFWDSDHCLLSDEYDVPHVSMSSASTPFIADELCRPSPERSQSSTSLSSNTQVSEGTTPCRSGQFVRNSSVSLSPLNRCTSTRRHSVCIGSVNTTINVTVSSPVDTEREHHACSLHDVPNDGQASARVNAQDLSLEVVSVGASALQQLPCDDPWVLMEQPLHSGTSGESLFSSGSNSQSAIDSPSPVSSSTNSMVFAENSRRLSLCSFGDRKLSPDFHPALNGKHRSDGNLRLSYRGSKAKRGASVKTVRFLDEPTIANFLPSDRSAVPLSKRRWKRRSSLVIKKASKESPLKRKISSVLP